MILPYVAHGAVLAACGRTDDARAAVSAAKARRPDLDRTVVDAIIPFSAAADTTQLMAALCMAGLEVGDDS